MRQHEHVPLVEIQALGELPRGQRLFDSLFVFENAPLDRLARRSASSSCRRSSRSHRTHTNYPLTVVVTPGPQVELRFSYDERVFDARDVERMLAHYRERGAVARRAPARVWCERRRGSARAELEALEQWNATEREYPLEAGYAALLSEQVSLHGERVAVRSGSEQVTYRELWERATGAGSGAERSGRGCGRRGGSVRGARAWVS